MGSSGLEPPTSRLSGVRSNHLSYEPIVFRSAAVLDSPIALGGDEEVRTPDPLRAKQVLSQLSYTPVQGSGCHSLLFEAVASKLNNTKFFPVLLTRVRISYSPLDNESSLSSMYLENCI